MRRQEPRPAEDLAAPEGLDGGPGPVGQDDLESDLPFVDEYELARDVPVPDQHLAAHVRALHRDRGEEAEELGVHVPEEAVVDETERRGGGFRAHADPFADPTLGAGFRIAATSSVISIPTGHQVIQRPHPTQPDSPNWSCHVPSLWVSHWR